MSMPGIKLGNCEFAHPSTGVLFLSPHGSHRLALVVMGSSSEGLRDAVSLAAPTIPPMTRSPVSVAFCYSSLTTWSI